jgi:hypothetical protein
MSALGKWVVNGWSHVYKRIMCAGVSPSHKLVYYYGVLEYVAGSQNVGLEGKDQEYVAGSQNVGLDGNDGECVVVYGLGSDSERAA